MYDDAVELGILWDRVIAIADEVVSALVTTSFSTMVRESGDLSCVLFAANARSLAQGTYSVPSFTGTAPPTLRHMLARHPPATLAPGDVLVTNDPWLGTGHLFDINVVRPVFRGPALVGYTMSVTHLADIGGTGYAATAREVYEEGLRIPVTKLMKGGEPNRELLELIEHNVRYREMVLGDLMANVTCNEVGARLLLELMDEYAMESLDPLADAIIGRTERAMRAAIRALPDGTYRHAVDVEAIDEPLRLAAAVRIDGDRIAVDFAGTSPAVPWGINVPLCYTRAFTNYSVKCLTTPELPNNEGAVAPIALDAPPGCILNAEPPSPTGGRHVIGHYVTPLLFGALAPAVPDRVQAECGMLSQLNCRGVHRDGGPVSSLFFASGGYGALAGMDGWPATPGPSNMIGTPVEVWERVTSTTVLEKSLIPDSGGAGRDRGGLGQRIAIRNDTGNPLSVANFAGRTEHAAEGLLGGGAGALRQHRLNGRAVHPKHRYTLAPGDVFELVEAGGGGMGPASERGPAALAHDLAEGYVTRAGALSDYGVDYGAAPPREATDEEAT